jgi:hypothetical protein
MRAKLIVASALVIVLGAVAASASAAVVLGSKGFTGPAGEGFGTAHPARIFNGGDLSGLVDHITWKHWGEPAAIGHGRNSIFKPTGGYYRRRVTVKLRASEIGPCAGHRAYTRLEIRFPKHPGGRLGPWRLWADASSLCSSAY